MFRSPLRSAIPFIAAAACCGLLASAALAQGSGGAAPGSASPGGATPAETAPGQGATPASPGESAPGTVDRSEEAAPTPSNPRPRLRARSEARTAWQMEITPGPMRLYIDPANGTPYWYFTYKVVNNTGQDLRFAPRFELVDDEGRITVSGQGVPSSITRLLLERLNNPLIEDQNSILGDILQGEANAKEGVVAFQVTDLGSKELFVYAANLSSERQGARDANGNPVELRRQFMIAYQVPGDALARGSEALDLLDEDKEPNPRWIWR